MVSFETGRLNSIMVVRYITCRDASSKLAHPFFIFADVVELADTVDLKSSEEIRTGSSPVIGTISHEIHPL